MDPRGSPWSTLNPCVLVVSSHSSCRLCWRAPGGVWPTRSPRALKPFSHFPWSASGSSLSFPVIFSISCSVSPNPHLHSLYTNLPFFSLKLGNITLYCTNSFIISIVRHHFSPSLPAPTPPEFGRISGISVPRFSQYPCCVEQCLASSSTNKYLLKE